MDQLNDLEIAEANEATLYLLLSLCPIDCLRAYPASNYVPCIFNLGQGNVNICSVQLFLTLINIVEKETHTFSFIYALKISVDIYSLPKSLLDTGDAIKK